MGKRIDVGTIRSVSILDPSRIGIGPHSLLSDAKASAIAEHAQQLTIPRLFGIPNVFSDVSMNRSRRRVAFLTMQDPGDFFIYDHEVERPLFDLGWELSHVPWDQPEVDWNEFDHVVIRSTWDYQTQVTQFFKVLEQIEDSRAKLDNSLKIVRWNFQKTYLRDLQERSVPIVPTEWFPNFKAVRFPELFGRFRTEELILKPQVGANADDTFRVTIDPPKELLKKLDEIFVDRPLMVQPFLKSILEVGEYSLFYFDSQFSHAILKRPQPGDFRVQEEHGGRILAFEADQTLRDAGRLAVEAVGEKLLYARVDLVRDPEYAPVLMELELIEPSLYFPYDDNSARRFAEAIDRTA